MTVPASSSKTAIRRNAQRHRFELDREGRVVGFINYREEDGVLNLVHTEVDAQLQGQGLAAELVRGALDDVRRAGEKIVPSCPYIGSWLKRNPDYAGLVAGH